MDEGCAVRGLSFNFCSVMVSYLESGLVWVQVQNNILLQVQLEIWISILRLTSNRKNEKQVCE